MYDSRARERRRHIEEQEALAAQLLRQVSPHNDTFFFKVLLMPFVMFIVNS